MAAYMLDPEPIPGELFYLAPHSEVRQVLDTALDLLDRAPAILTRIDEDRDARARVKKLQRRADAAWAASHTASFPEVTWPEARELEARELSLEQGCPRMPAEVAFVFFVLEGYLGSVTDRRARDLLLESQSLNLYLQSRGLKFPGWTTIRDNVHAISVATRSLILDAQLAMIRQEELDDFSVAVVDSTAVQANSAWPTDGRTLLGLLRRAFHVTQQLEDFGLPNVRKHWVPRWLRNIKRLLYQINMASGKPHATRKRKKHYRRLLEKARHILDHLLPQCLQRDPVTEVTAVPPSRRGLLARLWDGVQDDLISACAVYDYTYERIFEGQQRPAKDKLLSLGDPSAAYIEKGSREPVIGYKPQVARSGKGFVTALLVTEGNPADSTQLAPLTKQIKKRTGVQPTEITADDGYSVQALRDQLLSDGIDQVYFCGSKAKAFTAEEEWDDPAYQKARRDRSAVESLIFVLKSVFGFGRLRRRGLKAVEAELLGKVIAHNFYRMALLRRRAQAAAHKAA